MYKENTYWSTISCHKSKNWAILNSICASKAPKKQLTKICRMKWIFYHSRAMLANNWQETKINLLKVSQSRKQFLEFSILPKNERKTKKISSELSGYFFFPFFVCFWKNWEYQQFLWKNIGHWWFWTTQSFWVGHFGFFFPRKYLFLLHWKSENIYRIATNGWVEILMIILVSSPK